MLRTSPGSLTRLTGSQKTSSPISTQPSTLSGPGPPTRRAAASRDCALSVAVAMVRDSNASGGGCRPPPDRVLSLGQPLAAGRLDVLRLRGDRLDGLELVGRDIDREADDRTCGPARISGLADPEGAEVAVRDRHSEHLLDHAGPRAVRCGNRVDHDLGSLGAVDRVGVDRLAAEPPPG